MIDLLGQIQSLRLEIQNLIACQTTFGHFIDWEEWYEYFSPLNDRYNEYFSKIQHKYELTPPMYIDFQTKVENMIADDCDMRIYD